MTLHRSISHYACPRGTTFIAFLGAVETAGFDGIAVTLASLGEMSIPHMRDELRRRGLSVTSVNSAGYFLNSDPDRAREQANRNAMLLEATAELEAHALNVIVGGPGQGTWPLPTARQNACEALAILDEQAADLGVHLIIEPVHPLAIFEKGCLNTLSQTEAVIAGLQASSLNIDLFHSWWDPDLERAITAPKVPAGLLQICGITASSAPPYAARTLPENGCVDPVPIIRQFHATFPFAPVELELFSDQLPDLSLDEMLRAATAVFDAASLP